MNNFFILDWSWYVFKAYYALPILNDKNWNNINAIYWFIKMLINLLKQKPKYFLIAWDWPKNFRKEKYKLYKANRPKQDFNFYWQLKYIKKIINDIEIKNIEVEWYEADDVIFTLSNLFNNINYYIITYDKDLKVLLDKQNIYILDPQKDEIFDKNKFIKKYWFEPKYFLDWLALVWDEVDNIPWVKWIWIKTATELINKYHNIENIINNLNNIDRNISEKIKNDLENLIISKELVKLNFINELNNLKITEFETKINFNNLKNIIKEFNFKSLENLVYELETKYKQISLF